MLCVVLEVEVVSGGPELNTSLKNRRVRDTDINLDFCVRI